MAHGQEGLAQPPGPEGAPQALSCVRARRSFGPRGPGRPLLAMRHEPRPEYNAKNSPKMHKLKDETIN